MVNFMELKLGEEVGKVGEVRKVGKVRESGKSEKLGVSNAT